MHVADLHELLVVREEVEPDRAGQAELLPEVVDLTNPAGADREVRLVGGEYALLAQAADEVRPRIAGLGPLERIECDLELPALNIVRVAALKRIHHFDGGLGAL